MANPEHVALVRQGREAIDEWQQAHPDERLDLSDADLSGADLHGAYLSGADLWGANFKGANLKGARLVKADLGLVSLVNADLTGAYLTGADLNLTLLNGADLNGADLTQAKLSWANLSGANLPRTKLGFTVLDSLDLSGVKGLTDIVHDNRSSVDVDTLIASFRGAGNKLTPELRTFFLGAGVPQELLDALPKIVSEIRYCTSFLCCGQPDQQFAEKLTEDLRARGASCWWHPKSMTVGERTWHEISKERRTAEKMIVLCSAAALVRDGVRKEIEEQIDEEPNKLVPISLDDLWKEPGFPVVRATRDLKPFLLDKNYADFANKPYEEALAELLKGLRRPAVKRARRKKG
jgi:hypothetical protein